MKNSFLKLNLVAVAMLLTSCASFPFLRTSSQGDIGSSSTEGSSSPAFSEGERTSSPSSDEQQSSTDKSSTETIYPTSVSLPEAQYLSVGETFTISPSVYPYTATVRNFSFSVEDASIVSVSGDGLVEALAIGKTTLTVYAEGDNETLSATQSIIVTATQSVSKTSLDYTIMDFNQHNWYGGSDYCPTIGNPNILVIPVWFTDSGTYISNKDNVRSDIETAYFGSEEETGWHSAKSYYESLSKGRLSIGGTVSDWYECGVSSKTASAYEADYDSQGNFSDPTGDLVQDAADWYFANNPEEKRTDYDSDGNGYLDGVVLIYGAPDYYSAGEYESNNLWAYCYWTEETASKSSPKANVFFWASYDFMYSSGNKAKQRTGKSTYGTGDTSHCEIDGHTFIHEFGHVLGLNDYYDYNSTTNPAAGFSMQDQNVGSHDPYSAMLYGYVDPYIPTESCELTIYPFQDSNDVILLTPSWNKNDSPFDEYLLLELYTPTGLNAFDVEYPYISRIAGPDEIGIRLWHVDARLASLKSYNERTGAYTYNYNLTDPTKQYVGMMMTNTSYLSQNADDSYCSELGSDYYDYDELHLIRNDESETWKSDSDLTKDDLFGDGDSFSMSSFSNQFVESGKLDSGLSLGWSFSVSIDSSSSSVSAKITLTKE